MGFIIERDISISSEIAVLFVSCGPLAIIRRISFIIVNSFKGMFRRWSFSHIFQKIKRIKPTLTNNYTLVSIMFKRRMFRVKTSLHHIVPSNVFRRPFSIRRFAHLINLHRKRDLLPLRYAPLDTAHLWVGGAYNLSPTGFVHPDLTLFHGTEAVKENTFSQSIGAPDDALCPKKPFLHSINPLYIQNNLYSENVKMKKEKDSEKESETKEITGPPRDRAIKKKDAKTK